MHRSVKGFFLIPKVSRLNYYSELQEKITTIQHKSLFQETDRIENNIFIKKCLRDFYYQFLEKFSISSVSLETFESFINQIPKAKSEEFLSFVEEHFLLLKKKYCLEFGITLFSNMLYDNIEVLVSGVATQINCYSLFLDLKSDGEKILYIQRFVNYKNANISDYEHLSEYFVPSDLLYLLKFSYAMLLKPDNMIGFRVIFQFLMMFYDQHLNSQSFLFLSIEYIRNFLDSIHLKQSLDYAQIRNNVLEICDNPVFLLIFEQAILLWMCSSKSENTFNSKLEFLCLARQVIPDPSSIQCSLKFGESVISEFDSGKVSKWINGNCEINKF